MVEESRIGIYNYVNGLLSNAVTNNVYSMNEPQELTKNDVKYGFIVTHVGSIVDASEFPLNAYAAVRVYVEAFIPPMSRGRIDKAKYKAMEDAINAAINAEITSGSNSTYSIESDSILSMDNVVDTNANNLFYLFVKSFIVTIN